MQLILDILRYVEIYMNALRANYITTTKQGTAKPCVYFMANALRV